MKLKVTEIRIPPMSTVGYGEGIDESGRKISWVGDHRPMRELAEVVDDATEDFIEIELEDWQLLSVEEDSVQPMFERAAIAIEQTTARPLLATVWLYLDDDGIPGVSGGIKHQGEWRPMPIELIASTLREFVEKTLPT
jgi:hypothetical protein